ncbi:MAG: hypothetical protein J5877_00300 [Clostridia bacterium]|nr:hypothetical protein [Clostridia bacterium]
MNSKIRLLDCTLRDGAYIVNSNFGSAAVKGIIDQLEKANVDIIECGWLKNDEHKEGTSFFHVPDDLLNYIKPENKRATYVAMIDWDRYNTDYLPSCDGKSLDAIRVVFPRGKHREGIKIGNEIKKKGYRVFYQAANTLGYTDDELVSLADDMNEAMPESLSVVDTFGAMFEEDLLRIISILDSHLDSRISLGFHSHNNQQLSFALTMSFIKTMSESKRNIIIDSSLCGMGRGAGNATTELTVSYLNRKCGCHYNLDAIMDAIDIYMSYFKENYKWGYSTEYFIAGMYCTHVNNIAYLINNHRVNFKDMRNIIEMLPPSDRLKYDYDLLEQKYIENQSRYVDDTEAVKELKDDFSGREILLIAPGKSSLTQKEKIKKYIDENKPVVIGVNAILKGYDYDYMFFINQTRYEYAQKAFPDVFVNSKRIVLSNIKHNGGENELVVNFNSAIKRGWEHFDNAVICALRFLDYLGQPSVTLAGFDGFKTKYNESYADEFLPSLNAEGKWDELNSEITAMFRDFKDKAINCKNVKFLTDSIYNS